MSASLSETTVQNNSDFSIWDKISYGVPSLPLNDILSAEIVRDVFADHDALFVAGEKDCWNTGRTLWSFIGQNLAGGSQF